MTREELEKKIKGLERSIQRYEDASARAEVECRRWGKLLDGAWEEIEEYKVKLKALKPKTVYDLRMGDLYYYEDDYGKLIKKIWDDDTYDNLYRLRGRAYLSEKDYEDGCRRQALLEKARISQSGFKVDRHNAAKGYFYIYVDNDNFLRIGEAVGCIYKHELGEWETDRGARDFLMSNKPDLEWYFGLV